MTTTEDSLAQAIDQPEAYFIPLGAVTEGELSYERFMPTSFTYGAWGGRFSTVRRHRRC